jgi:hypothetical protein
MLSVLVSPLSTSYSEFDFVLDKGVIGNFLGDENEIYLTVYFVILLFVTIVNWILLYLFHWTGRVLFVATFILVFATDALTGDSVEIGLIGAMESLFLMVEGAMVYMMFFTDLKIQFERKSTVSLPIERP